MLSCIALAGEEPLMMKTHREGRDIARLTRSWTSWR
jgi:hypothetical protein